MMFYYDASGGYLGNKSFSMSNSTGGPSYAGTASISGTTPTTCAFIQIALLVRDNDWVDNVSFDVAGPSGDDDGDGITNNLDDYPNDILRAFATAFPTTGYQTLAFEDLWPAKGDFDFNDMVVSSQVEFAADAANNLVDATFTITLDAVGSGLSNGLAMVLVDANKTPLNQSIINSVSGDAILDPNVTNGIIVFDDVYAAQNSFYQNNGVGPAATAQTFSFTLTFNASVTNQTLVPDLYIFRKGERGREIHLHGFSATAAANTALNGTLDDFNGTYITESGLPWAIEIVSSNKSFKHPLEKVDILAAYSSFQNWAESGGSNETDWYASPDNTKVY
jgi:LruC domain-containing protein